MPQIPCPYPAGEIPSLAQHHPQHSDSWHHQKYANYNHLMAQSQHLNQAFQSAAFPSTSGATFGHLVTGSNGPSHSQILDPNIPRNDYPRYASNEVYNKTINYLPKENEGEDKIADEVIEPRDEPFVKAAPSDYNKELPSTEYPKVPTDYSKVPIDPTSSTNWSPSHSSLNMSLGGISSEYKYMNDPYSFPNMADPLNQHSYPNPPHATNKYWI